MGRRPVQDTARGQHCELGIARTRAGVCRKDARSLLLRQREGCQEALPPGSTHLPFPLLEARPGAGEVVFSFLGLVAAH